MPVKDFENRILGVISIPQISHTPDTEQEASQYIAAFISIYVLIVIVATAVALISTNRLVKPLFFLSASLAEFKIGTKNSKIPFSRTDEIGEMIALYNEMVDRLDLTILELKHKERDLAWRDIARQIAHEIKNPLTPIKLQMQFLLQVYNPTDPDWQERFRRFSDSLFQQIDNLNQLANSFSEFIRLPEIRLSPIELNEVIDDSLIILSEFSGKYVIENEIDNKIIVNGDKQQLVRLFVNLFKNAVQAIGENRQGLIHVDVTIENSKGVVRIRDNGSGIPPEMTDKVFLPNFTTKTSGMGIGLFIAKTIVAQHGGNIRFDSTPGEGTEFIVSLPLIQAKDS